MLISISVTFPPTMSVGRTTKTFLVSLVTSAVFIYNLHPA